MSLLRATALAPFLALGVSGLARAADQPTDICPAVVIDDAARNAAYYPGEPGRNRRDYSHIAVILSAVASCVETDDDQIVATVSIPYAVESGPRYRGGAHVKLRAALTSAYTTYQQKHASSSVKVTIDIDSFASI